MPIISFLHHIKSDVIVLNNQKYLLWLLQFQEISSASRIYSTRKDPDANVTTVPLNKKLIGDINSGTASRNKC